MESVVNTVNVTGWMLRSRGSINDGSKRFISLLKCPVGFGEKPNPFFTGGLESSTRGVSYRNVRLSTHLHLLSGSRMSAAVSPLPILFMTCSGTFKPERLCTYNGTLRSVRVTIVDVKQQSVLDMMSLCLCSCLSYRVCKIASFLQ
jgi:hypothetical protein